MDVLIGVLTTGQTPTYLMVFYYEMKGKEWEGIEWKGKEWEGKERKGKERMERKGKGRKEREDRQCPLRLKSHTSVTQIYMLTVNYSGDYDDCYIIQN